MGLLSRLTGRKTTKQTDDDTLLMLGMMLMVAADGRIDDEEMVALQSYYVIVPEFRAKTFHQLLDETLKLMRPSRSLADRVKLLASLSNQALKDKCFLFAADIALSSGDVDQAEDQLLDSMQRILGVTDETATKILEVLSIKYAVTS